MAHLQTFLPTVGEQGGTFVLSKQFVIIESNVLAVGAEGYALQGYPHLLFIFLASDGQQHDLSVARVANVLHVESFRPQVP